MEGKKYEIDLGRAQYFIENDKDKPAFQHYVVEILAKLDCDDLLDSHDSLINHSIPIQIRNRGDKKEISKDFLYLHRDIKDDDIYRVEFRRDKRGHHFIYAADATDEQGFKKYIFSAFHKKEVDTLVRKIIVARNWILDDFSSLNTTLRELRNHLLIQPEIFKRTYMYCVREIEEISEPFRALVDDEGLFKSALEEAIKFSNSLE